LKFGSPDVGFDHHISGIRISFIPYTAGSIIFSFDIALESFSAGKRFLRCAQILLSLCTQIGTVLFSYLERFLLCHSANGVGV